MLTDIDDNVYQTVTIGTEVWMAENLKFTRYPDGSAIPLVEDNTAWTDLADNNTDDLLAARVITSITYHLEIRYIKESQDHKT